MRQQGLPPLRIGVVGLGAAGAAASILLSDLGHAVTVLEQAPELAPVGAGLLLQPSGQLVLERLGIMNAVAERSAPIEVVEATTHRGRPLVRLRYAELGEGVRGFGVHRATLFDVLARALAERHVEVVLGAEISSWQRPYLLGASGAKHGPFDVVIAADGSRSRLRDSSGLARRQHEYAYGALWVVGRSETIVSRLHQVVRGTKDLVGLLPLGSDRCNFFWSQRVDGIGELRRRGFGAWRDEVLALCPEAEEVLAATNDFDDLTIATYRHVTARSGERDGLILLGDAWHAMSPHLGQGVNLALIDAYVLAHCMATAGSVAEATVALARARRVPLRWYGLVTMALSPFFQSNGHLKGWLRNAALPVMTRVAPIRKRMTLTMSGLAVGPGMSRLELPEGLIVDERKL